MEGKQVIVEYDEVLTDEHGLIQTVNNKIVKKKVIKRGYLLKLFEPDDVGRCKAAIESEDGDLLIEFTDNIKFIKWKEE